MIVDIENAIKGKGFILKDKLKNEKFYDFDGEWECFIGEILKQDGNDATIDEKIELEHRLVRELRLQEQHVLLELF